MRNPHSGVVLINVLVILALTSAVLLVMIRASDVSIARVQVYSEAAQGLALIAGGEASAIAALRRDMADAPGTDHLGEAWATIAQAETAITSGTFALQITDAQAQFNLTSVAGSGVVGAQILGRIARRLRLPEDTVPRILARLAQAPALHDLDQLIAEAGLTRETLDSLRALITVLPERSDINLNTALPELIFALTDNPVQARVLIGIRDRQGFLAPADVAAAKVILPLGIGYTSGYFRITTSVRVGATRQSLHSLLRRGQTAQGAPQVTVIARSTDR